MSDEQPEATYTELGAVLDERAHRHLTSGPMRAAFPGGVDGARIRVSKRHFEIEYREETEESVLVVITPKKEVSDG